MMVSTSPGATPARLIAIRAAATAIVHVVSPLRAM
jgi:hypothetical protein